MASVPLFLLFVVLFANEIIAQKNNSYISLGSWLSPESNSSWESASGLFAFGFYRQGNGFAIGIWLKCEPENIVVWTANRDSPPVSSHSVIELTQDGRLLLHNEKGIEILIANGSKSEHVVSASMLDSGNFVLQDKNDGAMWQSFDFPTDTILGGQNLSTGKKLVSAVSRSDHSSGNFYLIMGDDGNLVAYPVKASLSINSYWDFKTNGESVSQLTLSPTGSLYLWDLKEYTIKIVNDSNFPGYNRSLIFRATLDVDGIFKLYAHPFEKNTSFTGQTRWQALYDQCKVKGFCGFNSYCSTVAGKAVCQCYPGFKPVNGNNSMFFDCEQIGKDECKTNADPRMLYNVTPLPNMQLGLVPYGRSDGLNREDCSKSCQEDCDCGAALFENGTCRKYPLPLIFGRIDQNESTIALVKVSSGDINTPKPTVEFDSKKSLILTLFLILGSISSVCIIFAMSIFFIYMHQVYSYRKLSTTTNLLEFTEDCSLRTFSFDELVNLTGNFTEEVGRGYSGVVYKGTIPGRNSKIAVKKLDVTVDGREREFEAEITAIAQTHHRNLVNLIGYCIDGSKKLLVYEFMSNGSLADFLFKTKMHLSWTQRVKIALDVARGLLYLHEECEVCIIHCNIKPHNILMDEMWTAKISDFGFARFKMPEQSRTTTMGNEVTSDYMAPEWQTDASASVKVDIFSYGVVLLEIICCRKSIDLNVSSEEEIMLSSWVYNCFVRGELKKLVVDDYDDVEWKTMERMVKVGLWCVQEDIKLRPSIKNVILMLEGLKDIPIPPSPVPLI